MQKHNYVLILIILGCFVLSGCITSKADLETAKIEYLDDTYEVQKIECNEEEQYCRIKYKHTQTGAEDYVDTLGVTCEKGDKGEPGEKGDSGPMGLRGEKGEPFTYDDFTDEQLAKLRGEPFRFEDFTDEQLKLLKGEKGEDGQNGTDGKPGDSINIDKLSQKEIDHLRSVLGVKALEASPKVERYIYQGWFSTDDDGDVITHRMGCADHWKKIPIEHIDIENMPLVQVFIRVEDDLLPPNTWQDIDSSILNSRHSAVAYDDGHVYILYKLDCNMVSKLMDGNWKIIVDKSLAKAEKYAQELSGCKLLTINKYTPTNYFGYDISVEIFDDINEANFTVLTPKKEKGILNAKYGDKLEQKGLFGEMRLIQEEDECVMNPISAKVWACFADNVPKKNDKAICPDMKLITLEKDEPFSYFGNVISFTQINDDKIDFTITDRQETKSTFTAIYGDLSSDSKIIGDLRVLQDEEDCFVSPTHAMLKICFVDINSVKSPPTSGCAKLTIKRGQETWYYGYIIELTDIAPGGDVGYFEIITLDGMSSRFTATYGDYKKDSSTFNDITLYQRDDDCFIAPTSAMLWVCFGDSEPN